MPTRKRIEQNYFQYEGKPHSGLADPEKYGLTYSEVLELIEEGKWNNFRLNFNRKQRQIAKIVEQDFVCPKCKRLERDPKNWNIHGKQCLECSKREKGKRREKSSKLVKPRIKMYLCDFCSKTHIKVYTLLDKSICPNCSRKLNKFMNDLK